MHLEGKHSRSLSLDKGIRHPSLVTVACSCHEHLSFFNLILYPDNNLFDEDTELEGGGQPFPKHHILSVMYSGHDIGRLITKVHP